jgi:2-dehydro-3-deoxy-D-arabinonate dehydratase
MPLAVQRLCRLHVPGRGPTVGLVHAGRVHDVGLADPQRFGSIASVLAAFDAGRLPASVDAPLESYDLAAVDRAPDPAAPHLLAPIDLQEIWAAGVTYIRSREARREESKQGGDFYSLVYEADRPELFFKGAAHRCVGPGGEIVVRRDSEWNVPEPEAALVVTPGKRLFGYTAGNDVSSRSIEGANPLYLPQAKVYMGSAALGPVIVAASAVRDPRAMPIRLTIRRGGAVAFSGETSTARMKRSFEELVGWLVRENEFPHGAFLMTGTGIVPDSPFTLTAGDVVEIEIPEIGVLRNRVRLGAG